MMNRFVRRLANKHLNIDSEAGFALVLEWLSAERDRISKSESSAVQVPPEVASFLEGFEEFVNGLGGAFQEFERVVAERENSAQIVETELTAKNDELELVDKSRSGVVLRLLAVVKELSPENVTDSGFDELSSRERIVSLVSMVEKLAFEHRALLKLMEQLFQFSVAIASAKTQEELEKAVRNAISQLTGSDEKIHLYFARDAAEGLRYGRPPSVSVKQALLTLDMLENVFGGRLIYLPRDEMERPRVILVIAGDLGIYKSGGVHYHSLNALVPSILSAVEIIEYVSDERRKVEMKSDLLMASLVQRTLMPSQDPVGPEKIQILGRSYSASECGGDWWNFYQLKDGRTLIFVADVTGHGTASALVTAAVKGFCDSLKYRTDFDLMAMMCEINELLSDFHASCGRAMTLAAVVLDPSSRNLEYCLAAHPHPFIMRQAAVPVAVISDSTSEVKPDPKDVGYMPNMLAGKGSLLGMSNEVQFNVQTLTYEPGDFLILYTDGITEAMNPRSQAFGERRLFKFVKDGLNRKMKLPELLDHLSIELYRFTEEETLHDDVTLVVAKLS